MSYQVLARKWRPRNFQEVVGQQHVLQALHNALSQQRLHHAYLLSGTRGVGKTTIARILAKSLNCHQGITPTPCGECEACVAIDEGRFVDLLEIDAASRTKVEDTREILENVQYRPTQGRYKVYLIDEVHMLSRHSFNALLKTLEEPPPHVIFLLATTDPDRLPVTVLSRCLQFNLRALTREEIAAQLATVLNQENLPFDEAALSLLARSARGSMRDALSLTDQAIAQGDQAVRQTLVESMLGRIDPHDLLGLVEELAGDETDTVLQHLRQLQDRMADISDVLTELQTIYHQLALAQLAPAYLDSDLVAQQERMAELASRLGPAQIQVYYRIVLEGRRELPYAPDAFAGVEMTLLRLLAFRPVSDGAPADPGVAKKKAGKPSRSNVDSEPVTAPEPDAVPQPASAAGPATECTAAPQPEPAATPQSEPAPEPQPAPAPEAQAESPAAVERDPEEETLADLAAQQESILAESEQLRGSPTHLAEEPVADSAPDQESVGSNTPEAGSAPAAAQAPATRSLLATRAALQERLQRDTTAAGAGPQPRQQRATQQPQKPQQGHQNQQAEQPQQHQQPQQNQQTEQARQNQPPQEQQQNQPEPASSYAAQQPVPGASAEVQEQPATPEVPQAAPQAGERQQLSTGEQPATTEVTQAAQVDAWSASVDGLEVSGRVRQLLLHATLATPAESGTDAYVLTIAADQQALASEQALANLKEALRTLIGEQPLQVVYGDPGRTPFAIQQDIDSRRLDEATAMVERHPAITRLREELNAEIIPGSIKPL